MTVPCYLCDGRLPRDHAPDDPREPGICWPCWLANLASEEQRAEYEALLLKRERFGIPPVPQ